ncbi:MAG: sensor histidine kinase [Planctomycetota bacterium]
MDRPVRIAVVGDVDESLVGDLRQLPVGPEVRPLTSVVGDTEALMRFQPDILLARLADDPREDVGAVKLLQRLWPALAVGVVTDPRGEVELAPIAKRLSATLIVYPGALGQLAAAIEQLLHGGERPRPELFVDLAHGLADEINNPLMFASGHLQLLHAQLSAGGDDERCGQVQAALQGLSRIQAAVDRLRLLSEAADGPRARDKVDVSELIAHAVAARTPDAPNASVEMPPGEQVVVGDRAQLELAVRAIVEFADEVAAVAALSHLQLTASENALRVRLVVGGQGLATWRLPNTFEPFYPQRLIRGQSHGLGLFLAQTVVHGHHGQATARRLADGTLQLDFLLPAPAKVQATTA